MRVSTPEPLPLSLLPEPPGLTALESARRGKAICVFGHCSLEGVAVFFAEWKAWVEANPDSQLAHNRPFTNAALSRAAVAWPSLGRRLAAAVDSPAHR